MTLLTIIEKTVDSFFTWVPRKKPGKVEMDNACLIAHRGVHDSKLTIIENTDMAFARALELGCWGIELDVHATADHILVVNHDPTLTRLWGENVAISQLTFSALRQLVPQIPSLAEVVDRYGKRMHLFIELKAPFNAEAALVDALQSLEPCADYHLLSLHEPVFAALSTFPRQVMLLVTGHNNVREFCKISLQKHYGGVLGHYLLINNRKAQQLRHANQLVGVGIVNSKFALYRELTRGMQWIFSDNIEFLVKCLREEAAEGV